MEYLLLSPEDQAEILRHRLRMLEAQHYGAKLDVEISGEDVGKQQANLEEIERAHRHVKAALDGLAASTDGHLEMP